MDQHALNVLEFDKVKEIVREFAVSTLGRSAIEKLHPFTNLDSAKRALQEVSEMVRLYSAKQEPSLDGIYDIREIIHRSTVHGAVLDPAELLMVGETVQASRRIRSSLRKTEIDAPILKKWADRLGYHEDIESELLRVFDEQKAIRDSASSELARIRQAIRHHRTTMIKKLEQLMRGAWKEYLQENFYTNRDDRYVLPIDARYQNKVKGIIHDRSSTGTTVYMEPIELVEDGNALKGLHRDEEIEVRKILRELTELIAGHAPELLINVDVFQHIDFISAKARFGIRYKMEEPALNDDGYLKIINGKHPLLLVKHGDEGVIPLNLTMEKATHGLVISGPNTGGKTVVLKTTGLFVLMAQSGLHIPASGQTCLPVFTFIGADIGDEQSLEQSLSTFSSHIKNIRYILEQAKEKSLILIDELGSGTDPIEGGALSCAIMEQLQNQKATFIITTHLQDVKMFAYEREGTTSGSMDFDMATLQPTFRFRMGLPGQSNAIRIANRLGLPGNVIEKAKALVAERGESPEDLLTKIGEELRTAEAKRKEAEAIAEKAQHQYEENKRYQKKAEGQAKDILHRAETKSQKMVNEMERRLKDMEAKEAEFKKEWKSRLDYLIQQTVQGKTHEAPAEKSIVELKKTVELTKKELQEKKVVTKPLPQPEKKKETPRHIRPNELIPGARVKLEGMSDIGKVTKVWLDRKEIEVEVSSVTLRVQTNRILEIVRDKDIKKVEYSSVKVHRPEFTSNSVDVHGLTVDEMTPVVEKYLDEAFLSGQPYVYIVHGMGYGILRKAVHNMLKSNPTVKNYRLGGEYEGGTGVTMVTLNSSIIETKKKGAGR